jgi:hypothetical protein
MDIVEYVENSMSIKLPEWQKCAVRDLYELCKSSDNKLYIVMRPFNGRSSFYTYLKQNNIPIGKELTQYGITPKSC